MDQTRVGVKKILVVEDEVMMLEAISEVLNNNGFEVLQARDGVEGLRIALQAQPDAILLDILMPTMNGMEMMKKLRESSWGKNVPVVILSNITPDSDRMIEAVVESQPAYYLLKADVKLEEVVDKIKSVLKLKQ